MKRKRGLGVKFGSMGATGGAQLKVIMGNYAKAQSLPFIRNACVFFSGRDQMRSVMLVPQSLTLNDIHMLRRGYLG